jgi:hypothetical protein
MDRVVTAFIAIVFRVASVVRREWVLEEDYKLKQESRFFLIPVNPV